MRQRVLVLSPSPWSKTPSFCEEQRMTSWKREKFIVQSLEADEGLEPQASILYVSIGSGKLCKREAAHVSCLENIHRALSDHVRIPQVSWGFREASCPSFRSYLTKMPEQRFTRLLFLLVIAQKGVGRGHHHSVFVGARWNKRPSTGCKKREKLDGKKRKFQASFPIILFKSLQQLALMINTKMCRLHLLACSCSH